MQNFFCAAAETNGGVPRSAGDVSYARAEGNTGRLITARLKALQTHHQNRKETGCRVLASSINQWRRRPCSAGKELGEIIDRTKDDEQS